MTMTHYKVDWAAVKAAMDGGMGHREAILAHSEKVIPYVMFDYHGAVIDAMREAAKATPYPSPVDIMVFGSMLNKSMFNQHYIAYLRNKRKRPDIDLFYETSFGRFDWEQLANGIHTAYTVFIEFDPPIQLPNGDLMREEDFEVDMYIYDDEGLWDSSDMYFGDWFEEHPEIAELIVTGANTSISELLDR